MIAQRESRLDVRSVEPKNRFDTIMAAWNALHPGDALYLTVDHDPKCMYYTLLVDYGEKALLFEYLQNGPETWEVKVTRQ